MPEPFCRKGPARAAFEITFKGSRDLDIGEIVSGQQSPRLELASVRRLASIVRNQSFLNIAAKAGVDLIRSAQALKDIDVIQPALLRASRFGGQAGFARWRYLFAGGAIASVALIALVSGPFNPTIPNPTISNPTVINPTVVKPALAHPTAASQVSSPIASVNYAISTAEIEWRARATPALDLVEPLEMKSLELKSIDITPLGVAPLMVSALGDGSNW